MQAPHDDLADTYLQALPHQPSPPQLLAGHSAGQPLQIVPDNLVGIHGQYGPADHQPDAYGPADHQQTNTYGPTDHEQAAAYAQQGGHQPADAFPEPAGQLRSNSPVDAYHAGVGHRVQRHHAEVAEMHRPDVAQMHHGDIAPVHPDDVGQDDGEEVGEVHHTDVAQMHHEDIGPVHHQDMDQVHHQDLNQAHHRDLNQIHHQDLNQLHHHDMNEAHHQDLNQVHHQDLNQVHHQDLDQVHHQELNQVHHQDFNQVHHQELNQVHHQDIGPVSDMPQVHHEDISQVHHQDMSQVHPDMAQVHHSDTAQLHHEEPAAPLHREPVQVHQDNLAAVQLAETGQLLSSAVAQMHSAADFASSGSFGLAPDKVGGMHGVLSLAPAVNPPPSPGVRRLGRPTQSMAKVKAPRSGFEEESREAKRKRIISANSLQNLQHKKVCPACGKNHGNAKKGECRNMLPNGEICTYVFGVKPTARSVVSAPIGEQLPAPGTQRHFKAMHAHFLRLVNEAKNWASKTGMSVAVFATGAVHTSHKPSEPCEQFLEDVFIRNARLGDSKLKVATFKYGTGGAARTLTNNYKVLEYISNVTADNLSDACGAAAAAAAAAAAEQVVEDPSSPMKNSELQLAHMPESPPQQPMTNAALMHALPGPSPSLKDHGHHVAGHLHRQGGTPGGTPQHTQHSQMQLTPGGSFHAHHHAHGPTPPLPMEQHHLGEGLHHHYRPNSQGMLMVSRAAELTGRGLDAHQHAQLTKLQTLDAFLQSVNCSQYLEAMKKEDVDMTALLFCSEEDLHNLGLPLGARKRIMEALKWNRLETMI